MPGSPCISSVIGSHRRWRKRPREMITPRGLLDERPPSLFADSGGKTNTSQPCSGWCTWKILPFLAAAISAHQARLRMATMVPVGLVSRTFSFAIASLLCKFRNHASKTPSRHLGPSRCRRSLVSRRQTVPIVRAGTVVASRAGAAARTFGDAPVVASVISLALK